jgi:hypothetical protein
MTPGRGQGLSLLAKCPWKDVEENAGVLPVDATGPTRFFSGDGRSNVGEI